MKLGSGELQMGKVLVIAALSVAGTCGVAACGAADGGRGWLLP